MSVQDFLHDVQQASALGLAACHMCSQVTLVLNEGVAGLAINPSRLAAKLRLTISGVIFNIHMLAERSSLAEPLLVDKKVKLADN